MRTYMQPACDPGEIRLLDLHIGVFFEKKLLDKFEHPFVLLGATVASAAVGNGHVWYPLEA